MAFLFPIFTVALGAESFLEWSGDLEQKSSKKREQKTSVIFL